MLVSVQPSHSRALKAFTFEDEIWDTGYAQTVADFTKEIGRMSRKFTRLQTWDQDVNIRQLVPSVYFTIE